MTSAKVRRECFQMNIQLPNGQKKILDEHIDIKEKLSVVNELVEEWHSAIIKGWENDSIRFFLDGLANYLVWHKEEDMKNKHDKEVLSIRKIEQMEGMRKSPTIPFSKLSKTRKDSLGLDGGSDE
jgi:hypothetical protein